MNIYRYGIVSYKGVEMNVIQTIESINGMSKEEIEVLFCYIGEILSVKKD